MYCTEYTASAVCKYCTLLTTVSLLAKANLTILVLEHGHPAGCPLGLAAPVAGLDMVEHQAELLKWKNCVIS